MPFNWTTDDPGKIRELFRQEPILAPPLSTDRLRELGYEPAGAAEQLALERAIAREARMLRPVWDPTPLLAAEQDSQDDAESA